MPSRFVRWASVEFGSLGTQRLGRGQQEAAGPIFARCLVGGRQPWWLVLEPGLFFAAVLAGEEEDELALFVVAAAVVVAAAAAVVDVAGGEVVVVVGQFRGQERWWKGRGQLLGVDDVGSFLGSWGGLLPSDDEQGAGLALRGLRLGDLSGVEGVWVVAVVVRAVVVGEPLAAAVAASWRW